MNRPNIALQPIAFRYAPNTFSVPDLNIEAQMLPGKTNTLSFTSPAAGEYRFYSAVLDDFETMKGKLIVR
jgi:heme/copper-type cytochrome/quinol oxidase subunit 2